MDQQKIVDNLKQQVLQRRVKKVKNIFDLNDYQQIQKLSEKYLEILTQDLLMNEKEQIMKFQQKINIKKNQQQNKKIPSPTKPEIQQQQQQQNDQKTNLNKNTSNIQRQQTDQKQQNFQFQPSWQDSQNVKLFNLNNKKNSQSEKSLQLKDQEQIKQQQQEQLLEEQQQQNLDNQKSQNPNTFDKLGQQISQIEYQQQQQQQQQNQNQQSQNIYYDDESIDYGLPFYHVIKKLMFTSGDLINNNPESVKMMHSQIEILIKQILTSEILQKLIKKSKETEYNTYDIDLRLYKDQIEKIFQENKQNQDQKTQQSQFDQNEDLKVEIPRFSLKIKREFTKYFQSIFTESCKSFVRFKQVYKEIKENAKIDDRMIDSDNNDNSEESDEDSVVYRQNSSSEDIEEDEEEEEDEEIEEDQQLELKNISDLPQNNVGLDLKNGIVNGKQSEDDEDFQKLDQQQENIDFKNQRSSKQGSNIQRKQIQKSYLQICEERTNFNALRSENMDKAQWDYFMKYRSITFIKNPFQQGQHNKKEYFVEFLDYNGLKNNYNKILNSFAELINYVICKVVQEIVENSIRSRDSKNNLHIISEPITENEVKTVGNTVIQRYIKSAKKYIFQKDKQLLKAFQVFCEEYHSRGYGKTLIKEKNLLQFEAKTVKEKIQYFKDVWRSLKQYRKTWVERVIAEKEMRSIGVIKDLKEMKQHLQYASQSDYLTYLLIKKFEDPQNFTEKNYPIYFKQYFFNQESDRTKTLNKKLTLKFDFNQSSLLNQNSSENGNLQKQNSVNGGEQNNRSVTPQKFGKKKKVKLESIDDAGLF